MANFYKKCQNLAKNERVLGINEAQIETKKEQGRSMVEMLGVLAIVGVLSIGAISGYRYAMNKYRANQVTNELNLLSHQVAIAMMSKDGLSDKLSLVDPYGSNPSKLTSAGYTFLYGCGESGTDITCAVQSKFHFTVQDVSAGVCKELLQMTENMQYIKQILPNNCAVNANEMTFVFEVPDAVSEVGKTPQSISLDPVAKQALCSGNGVRIYGKCICRVGYNGEICETSDDSCSGNGTLRDGNCACDSDHYGINCQYSVSKCEEHGTYYVTSHGACFCSDNYGGEECDVENACNGYGYWENCQDSYGHCICDDGHYGSDCALNTDPCGEHASWDFWNGMCICTDGYEGVNCDIEPGTVCKNGSWVSYATASCSCASGWYGANCSLGNGTCYSYNKSGAFCSSCKKGLSGALCDQSDKCSGHGQWQNTSATGGYCSCDTGYVGATCATINENCNEYSGTRGACYSCKNNMSGALCDQADQCSGNGTWRNNSAASGYCSCNSGYGGTDCSIGNCMSYNRSKNYCGYCTNGYGGLLCEEADKCTGSKKWYNNSNGTGYCS